MAISRNRLYSISLFLLDPSAIFEGTEIAALQICVFNPNFSSSGSKADNP